MSATAPTPITPGAWPSPPTPEAVGGEIGKRGKKTPEEWLLQLLAMYFDEAKEHRESGADARDVAWAANWDAYFSRYPTSEKASWQARERMPEAANFVDRFVAAFRLALTSNPHWFNIHDPRDRQRELDRLMTDFVRVNLDHCGRNAAGHRIGFEGVFGDVLKAGALMVLAISVTVKDGKILVEPVDARELYYDPKGRGLYRIRRFEIDYWELDELKQQKDSAGKPIWDVKAIEQLQAHEDMEHNSEVSRAGGYNTPIGPTPRKPIVLDEYLCTIVDQDGKLQGKNQLVVRANERFVIRGPEPNPWWHGKDWILMAPAISVPFSIWGRAYMDLFRQLADTFTELTNLILDGVFASAIKAHMVWLDALQDASQISDGIAPGATILAHDDWPAGKDFVKPIELGSFEPSMVRVWEAIKSELREGAGANELSLGQVPPKGDITATEINASTQGTSVLNNSLAKDIEEKLLQPMLELVMGAALQHFDPEEDPEIAEQLGEPMARMIVNRRQEFRDRRFTFKATGISSAIDRGRRLRQLLGFLQILGQSEVLLQQFMQEHDAMKVIEQLLIDFDIDPQTLRKSKQQKEQDDAQRAQQMALAARLRAVGAGAEGGAGQPTPQRRASLESVA